MSEPKPKIISVTAPPELIEAGQRLMKEQRIKQVASAAARLREWLEGGRPNDYPGGLAQYDQDCEDVIDAYLAERVSADPSTDYRPFAQTPRFDIFHHRIVRNPDIGHPRDLYTAWFHDDDVPRSVCEVTINPFSALVENYVEWVQVDEGYRRQGIATEVLRAIEEKVGVLNMDGATDAGESFCEAYVRRFGG